MNRVSCSVGTIHPDTFKGFLGARLEERATHPLLLYCEAMPSAGRFREVDVADVDLDGTLSLSCWEWKEIDSLIWKVINHCLLIVGCFHRSFHHCNVSLLKKHNCWIVKSRDCGDVVTGSLFVGKNFSSSHCPQSSGCFEGHSVVKTEI